MPPYDKSNTGSTVIWWPPWVGHWQSLLQDLEGALAWEGPSPWGSKRRAALALKNVVRALRSKRIVVETPSPASRTLSQVQCASGNESSCCCTGCLAMQLGA